MADFNLVLGIETSCDETAAAIVRGDGTIMGERIASQIAEHAPYGGVVPEIAARAHLTHLDGLIAGVMADAGVGYADLDAVAVTSGPGLAGGLIVGTMTARAIATVHGKPLLTINHLEGHALTARLTDGVAFPYLLLLVSGGHTQILAIHGVGHYERLASTIDDALGEAFDKVAKALGLPYPGGPEVERLAKNGDPTALDLPRPLAGRDTLDMSFSGLKTAVARAVERDESLSAADVCASFQGAVGDVLADRLARAMEQLAESDRRFDTLVVAGGVAANRALRARLETMTESRQWRFIAPPLRLCTDNAAMIAWAGCEHLALGDDHTDEGIRPRWPLDGDAASVLGSGRKGAKA